MKPHIIVNLWPSRTRKSWMTPLHFLLEICHTRASRNNAVHTGPPTYLLAPWHTCNRSKVARLSPRTHGRHAHTVHLRYSADHHWHGSIGYIPRAARDAISSAPQPQSGPRKATRPREALRVQRGQRKDRQEDDEAEALDQLEERPDAEAHAGPAGRDWQPRQRATIMLDDHRTGRPAAKCRRR